MTGKFKDESSSVHLNIFWLGFIVYIVSYLVSQSGKVSFILCNVFQIIGFLMFIPAGIYMAHLKLPNNYLRYLYIFFMVWTLGIILRGLRLDYESIKELLFRPTLGVFLYLVPLTLLFRLSPKFIKKISDVITILGVIYLMLILIFIKDLLITYNEGRSREMFEYFTQHLSLPAGFLLLTYIYNSAKRNWFALFIIFLAFLLAVIRARRGLIFMTFSTMFFAYLIYQYVNKTKIINMVLSVFIIIILSAVALKIYDSNRQDTFRLITERIGQQTRTGVEQYFYMDMKSTDWLIGKGINAKYFCPGVTEGVGRVSIFRSVIETGYLQIILNGGIISLSLLALIIFPAIFLGIFNSANVLSKAAGIWLVLFLFYIYPGTPTIFSMNYILTWISIGICYSAEIRKIPEEEMINLLRNTSDHLGI